MITSANIKADLDKIRYYYTRKETFDKAFDSVIKNNILDLIEKYNVAMSIAEPKLFYTDLSSVKASVFVKAAKDIFLKLNNAILSDSSRKCNYV